jgi:hypothetical protein
LSSSDIHISIVPCGQENILLRSGQTSIVKAGRACLPV